MRLIDVDKLPYVNKVILVDDLDGDIIITVAKEHTSYVNDETPTVEAIPVEWLKKWLSRKVFVWDATTMANEKDRLQAIENIKYGFETMLKDWEKENDS